MGLLPFALFSDNNCVYFFRKVSTKSGQLVSTKSGNKTKKCLLKSGKDTLEINCSTVACSAANWIFIEYQRVSLCRSGSWARIVAVLQLISGLFCAK